MNQFLNLEGHTAVVTGAAQGIGASTAARLADAGANVFAADLGEPDDSRFNYVRTDVSDESQVRALMEAAAEASGRIDCLVNNAGIHLEYATIDDMSTQDVERCHSVNTQGVVYGIRHAARHMHRGGSIVNVSSASAVLGVGGLGSYTMSKSAVLGITRTAAIEYASRQIRVNAICPGSVRTPMAMEEGGEDLLAVEATATPLGRICEPGEVAALIHFLAAPDCAFITGQWINICGGLTAGLSDKLWQTLLDKQ